MYVEGWCLPVLQGYDRTRIPELAQAWMEAVLHAKTANARVAAVDAAIESVTTVEDEGVGDT